MIVSNFLNLQNISEATLVHEPFKYAVISNLITPSQALLLQDNLPTKAFYRSKRQFGSDKTYNMANQILLELGDNNDSCFNTLSDEWQEFIKFINSSEYRKALSDLLEVDLIACHLELTLKQYSEHDFISAHTDRDWVTATHLFFLNSHWDDAWGGILQFLNGDGKPFLFLPPLFQHSVAFVRADNSWHEVTPINHPLEKRLALQVAFWNTIERYVLPGRVTMLADQ